MRARHEHICRVITKGLDRARSLLEFGANENSAAGDSSGTSSHGGNSSGAGEFSS